MTPLPHDLQAEQAILGALLFDNALLERMPELRREHFFDPAHGLVFSTIAEKIRSGGLADAVTLKDTFKRSDTLASIGGAGYIADLLSRAAPLSSQAGAYAEVIQGLSLRREIVKACNEAIHTALKPPEGMDPEGALLSAMQALGRLGEEGGTGEAAWRSAGEIAVEAVERAFEGKAKGISTGLPKLDACTGGGRPGSLWVLGGATSMGKSVGGQQFAVNVARQDLGVAYVHLEMDHDEVGLRIASALAWEFRRINDIGERGNPYYLSAANQSLMPDQWDRMRRAARDVAPTLKIFVDDRPGRTVAQIEAAVMRLFQRMRRENIEPGLVVVDHEGLIAPDGKFSSALEAASSRANQLKDMAKRLGVWTIALSQITKEGARADGDERLPTAQDLNYGSALSQAAHVVILLHRKAYYAERKPHTQRSEDDIRATRSRETLLIVDKARGGRRAHVEALMDVASAVLIEQGGAA